MAVGDWTTTVLPYFILLLWWTFFCTGEKPGLSLFLKVTTQIHRWEAFENKVSRRILGTKRGKVTLPLNIITGIEWRKWLAGHVARMQIKTSIKLGRDHSKWVWRRCRILLKWSVTVSTGLIWLRSGSSGVFLWTRNKRLGYKRRGISYTRYWVFDSQERICSMDSEL